MVVAATGFFDGVHRGHLKVLNELCRIAESKEVESNVITFWPHPRSVLQQDAYALRLLTSVKEKEELIKSIGVDDVKFITFTKEFSNLSTMDFLQKYIIDQFGVSDLVIGYDHRLGHDVNQTQNDMISIAERLGLKVHKISEFLIDGDIISSTKIRGYLSAGDVEKANLFLGYRYGLYGVVVSGEGLGHKMGFPTANMQLYEPLKVVPARGVYAVLVEVLGGTFAGICNIGIRPTITNDNKISIETNILGFDENIYGLDIKIEFVKKLRNEIKFPSIDALKEQLKQDKEEALSFFNTYGIQKLR